jgi:hypothetical protein
MYHDVTHARGNSLQRVVLVKGEPRVFDNLFLILGPVFSAAILVSVVLVVALFPMHRLGWHRLRRRDR